MRSHGFESRIEYQYSGVEEMVSLAGLITQRPPVRVWPPLLNVPAKIVGDLASGFVHPIAMPKVAQFIYGMSRVVPLRKED